MILFPCRRCGQRPHLIGLETFWDKENGHWFVRLHRHPEIFCPRCHNHECGCTLNDLYPDKNHYRFATAGQVIGQWNQRNAPTRTNEKHLLPAH